MIHSTAVIDKSIRLPKNIEVGPYAILERGIEIGEGTKIGSHAVVKIGTLLGKNCKIDSHVVVGGLPQDLHFDPSTASGVKIGDDVVLREGVTINRATQSGGFTQIGKGCFLMANSHVAHDCVLGDSTILANGVLLAGHVKIGARSFIGGNAAVHQFCQIGSLCMISGLSRVSQDVPPFVMAAERNELIGLNLVGLQRNGFKREQIKALKRLYSEIFKGDKGPSSMAKVLLNESISRTSEIEQFLGAMANPSKKGVARPRQGND